MKVLLPTSAHPSILYLEKGVRHSPPTSLAINSTVQQGYRNEGATDTDNYSSSFPPPSSLCKSVRKRRGNRKRRRRGDDNDEDYLPKTDKGNSFRGSRAADGVEHDDAALAAALNLSLMDQVAVLPSEYIQETEKATRKYRKQRKPSGPLPRAIPRQEEEWIPHNDTSDTQINSDEIEQRR